MRSPATIVRRCGALLLCGTLATCGSESAGTSAAATPSIVDAPGLQAWLQARRGAPLLVNFWATWCQPCCEEMPELVAATRTFRDAGGVVVGVAMERTAEVTAAQGQARVERAMPRLGIDFPVLVCSEADFGVVGAALGVELTALPLTVAIDRGGAVVAAHRGRATRAELEALAQRAAR